ncbi:hypothetical protein RvY_17291 [Ramazzottius varieornatus]|uniref:HMG box domain-containing protein n=1 Tax=Ramazzottius varieornatus TaxID=947166 RepID=A0A1D1W218_RAMVA|nr:hypothetical protein RvY_17291 [Ramazzottius varieornatus]
MPQTKQKVKLEEKNQKMVNGTAESAEERQILDWSLSDVKELLSKMQAALPRNDRVSFAKRVTKLKWEEITAGEHSAEECRAQWDKIVKNVRTFRNLSEILQDAMTWVNDPQSSVIPKETFPDYPKMPLAQFMKYKNKIYGKLKAKYPELDVAGLNQKIRKRFEKLSEEEKNQMNEEYKAEMDEYHRQLEIFRKNHPEYAVQPKGSKGHGNVNGKRTRGPRKLRGPDLPKTPFDMYFQSRATDVEPETDTKALKETLKAKWDGMSDKRKTKYIEQAIADQKRYKEELAKFSEEHPEFVVKRLKPRVTKADNKVLSETYGRPKMPAGQNGYSTFCAEYHQQHGNEPRAEGNKSWMKDAADAWKALSNEEKSEYQTRIKKEWEDYRAECEEYLSNVPEERREEERAILKCEPPSNNSNRNSKRKRNASLGSPTSESGKKTPKKGPSGRAIFMLDNETKFQEENPEADPNQLKKLMHKAYDKLSVGDQAIFEERAHRLSFLG